MRLPSMLIAASLVSACGPWNEFCTADARASVQVTVVDARGRVQGDARVTFTLDGGAEQDALCTEGMTAPTGPCASWMTNYERPGQYVVTATSADGRRTARRQLSVGEDECHVITERVTLTLPD